MKESIKTKLAEFLSLCKSHNVKNIFAFGSAVTKNFDDKRSDIDLLIEIDSEDSIIRGENLMSLWDN
ncbi:MAG: nucleotidyltransferase domain-containing protein [Flavobacterium micromati]|nr:nucleotidyltransferase domain-containing protein [Flavobacterium micromati]